MYTVNIEYHKKNGDVERTVTFAEDLEKAKVVITNIRPIVFRRYAQNGDVLVNILDHNSDECLAIAICKPWYSQSTTQLGSVNVEVSP